MILTRHSKIMKSYSQPSQQQLHSQLIAMSGSQKNIFNQKIQHLTDKSYSKHNTNKKHNH